VCPCDGADGTVLILDAGTGIGSPALELPRGLSRVDVLLTHLRMDHIIGLGFALQPRRWA